MKEAEAASVNDSGYTQRIQKIARVTFLDDSSRNGLYRLVGLDPLLGTLTLCTKDGHIVIVEARRVIAEFKPGSGK
jgi:hypothetical protein